jgi:hypothetical protein
MVAGRTKTLVLMAFGVVACSDSAGPADSEVIELFPTDIGTTWVYVTRDTLLAGIPETVPWIPSRSTARLSADTTANGETWHVGSFGQIMPEHYTGSGPGLIYLRNAVDGLHFLSVNPQLPLPLRDRVVLLPPTRVGREGGSWTVRALNERVETPAGVFFAARYEHTLPYYDPSFGPPPERWVVPGTGGVQGVHGGNQGSVRCRTSDLRVTRGGQLLGGAHMTRLARARANSWRLKTAPRSPR